MKQRRVTLEIVPREDGSQEAVLYLNEEGRTYLIEELEALSERDDHVHLFTKDFAGYASGLRNVKYTSKNHLGHHLMICFRPDKWDSEHNPETLYEDEDDAVGKF